MSRRLSLTLEREDETAVATFADPDTVEHDALRHWATAHGISADRLSDAALLRTLIRAGAEALRAQALDAGYAALAASYTDAEHAEHETLSAEYARRVDAIEPA